MAFEIFNIGEGIVQNAGHNFNLKGLGIQTAKSIIFSLQQSEQEESDLDSYLGTPIFDPIRIQGGKYPELGTGKLIPYAGGAAGPGGGEGDIGEGGGGGEGSFLIPTVLIEVTQTRNIVTTAIQGRNGTIKEFISDGDFIVTLTGIINGENRDGKVVDIGNFFPQADVAELINICKATVPITITSDFLGLFELDSFVITSYNIPQREGSRDMQPFQITMLSDVPIDLEELSTL